MRWPGALLALYGKRVIEAHRERDALACRIDLEHFDLDDVTGLDHLARITDEAPTERRYVHQSVLVHADVDEGTEVGHVADHTLEHHAGVQVGKRLDPLGKDCRAKLRPGVAPGLFELTQDVTQRHLANLHTDKALRVDRAHTLGVADQFSDRALLHFGNALDDRVRFGVYRRGIEWIVATTDAQETRALFKGACAKTRHLAQLLAVAKRSVAVTVLDDRLRNRSTQARDTTQQCRGSTVQLDAHTVHAVLDHRIETLRQPVLVHVVLVLPDSDRLRVDLDQLGQRVLQAPCDRDRAANADVDVGKLLTGDLGGRVHRRTSLADHDTRQPELGVRCDQLGNEFLRFARCRSVADRHQLAAMACCHARQRDKRLRPAFLWHMRMDRHVLEQLAGTIERNDLDPGAQSGIEPDARAMPRRCRQQQIAQVGGKHTDRLCLCHFAKLCKQIADHMQRQPHPPCPAHDLEQPGIGTAPPCSYASTGGNQRLARMRTRLIDSRKLDRQLQHTVVSTAEHGKCTVRRDLRKRLVVFEIITELRPFGLLALNESRTQFTAAAQQFTHPSDKFGIFGKTLHQDLARTVKHCLHVGKTRLGIQECLRFELWVALRLGKQQIGKRLDAGFACDLRPGAPLRFVGQVEILEA